MDNVHHFSKKIFRLIFSVFLIILVSSFYLESGAYAGSKLVFKIADAVAAKEIVNQVFKKFCDNLSKKSGGKIEAKLYTGGQLGGEKSLCEQTSLGTIEMVVSGWIGLPEFEAVYLPFLFRDNENLISAFRGELGQLLSDAWKKEQGVRLIGYMVRSPRQLTSNRLVKDPEDAKGMKIRVPQIDQFIDSWRSVGALPTAISFPELFSALQTGVVEAQENPVELIYASKFYEVQKYITLINYIRACYFVGVNDKWWSDVPEDQKNMIIEELRIAENENSDLVASQMEGFISKLESEGMKVIRPDISKWKAKMYESSTIPHAEKKWGKTMLKKIQEQY